MVVATQGTTGNEVTAITLLGGVELFLLLRQMVQAPLRCFLDGIWERRVAKAAAHNEMARQHAGKYR